jgi:hypothetical protein
MPTPSKPPAPYKPSISDLVAFAFCAWLLFIFARALWSDRTNIPYGIAHFFGEALYEIVFDYIPGAALLAPVFFILSGEEKLVRRWSQGWTKPHAEYAVALVRYRFAAWTLYAAGLALVFLYGKGMLG